MGFAASQARLLMLTARQSDLQLQAQFVNQARMQLANVSGALFTVTSNLEPESPQAQALQARIAAIQSIDKTLELQTKRIDAQILAIQTEVEGVQKTIQKNIQMSFRSFATA